MKLRVVLPLVLFGALAFGGGTDVFEYRIPPGWTLRDACLSESGWKALLVWQDTDPDRAFRGEFASKLYVLDDRDRLLKELNFDRPRHLRLSREDSVILTEGRDGFVSLLSVIDRSGQTLFERRQGLGDPFPALLGNEIGLGQWNGLGPADLVGSLKVIDSRTGNDIASLEQPVAGITGPLRGFIPIGVDHLYLAAGGKSVALASYEPPESVLWKIENVGGDVATIEPLDERYVAFSYHQVRPEGQIPQSFLGGMIVLEWRSGKIVFRQESTDPQKGLWSFLHLYGVNVSLMDGDLFFTRFDRGGGGGVRVARASGVGMRWNPAKIRTYKMLNAKGDDRLLCDSRWTAKSKKDVVRLERILFAEEK